MNNNIVHPDETDAGRNDVAGGSTPETGAVVKFDLESIPVRVYAAVVVCLAIIVNLNTVRNGFVFDDVGRIIGNPALATPASFLRSIWTEPNRFLTQLTYAFTLWTAGPNSSVFHMVNVLVHATVCGLVYAMALIVSRGTAEKVRGVIPPRTVAFLAAALFACHPLNSEAVNYLSARSSSLAAMFYLLTVVSFAMYTSAKENRLRGFWYSLAIVGMVCGLASKESCVTVPVMLIVYDYLFVNRFKIDKLVRRLVWPHGPFWAVSAAAVAVRYVAGWPEPVRPVWTNLMTQAHVVTGYLQLVLMPVGLNVEYVVPNYSALFELSTLLSVATLAVVLVLVVMAARFRPVLTFGGLWFFVALIPSSTVVPFAFVMNEHRTYLPMAGLVLLFPVALDAVLSIPAVRAHARVAGVAALVLLALLATGTVSRNRVWKDDLTLWYQSANLLLDNDQAYVSHARFGKALLDQGRPQEALPALQHAVNANPRYVDALIDLARAQRQLGRIPQSIESLKKAVKIEPNRPDTHIALATVLQTVGRHDDALAEAKQAVALDPSSGKAYLTLGKIYRAAGKFDDADRSFRRALDFEPTRDDAEKSISALTAQRVYINTETTRLDKAIEAKPDDPQNYAQLGLVRLAGADVDGAETAFKTALEKEPSFGPALLGLGNIYARTGRANDAIQLFRRAAQSKKYAVQGYSSLVQIYAATGKRNQALRALNSLEKASGKTYPDLRRKIETVGK